MSRQTQSLAQVYIYGHLSHLDQWSPLTRQNSICNHISPRHTKHLKHSQNILPVLHSSIRCKEAIPNLPLTARRRPKNLRDTLVQASTSNTNTATGFQPCNTPTCKTCIHTTPSRTFTSAMNNKTYNIRHNSHNVIYLITCIKCKKQYVGQTSQQLRSRFTQHRFTINSDNGSPVARHFNSPGHSILPILSYEAVFLHC